MGIERDHLLVRNARYNIVASYPDTETEVFQYYLDGNLMFTATVTYTDSTKESLDSVVWS